ncbi:MAG: glycosyltransferase family A protein [Cyanobacteria bacterium P01_F01_bin.53]
MPLVSIIIPSYNSENTVLATVESVLQQTLKDFEIILINDGSTDGTLALLNAINDPRLRIFSFENGGLATARNRGIQRATGDYLTFLDADDLWTPDKLEKQVNALQQAPGAGVAYSWTRSMDSSGELFYDANADSFTGDVYAQLLLGNFITSGSNIMVTKEAAASVGLFDGSLNPCEDWDYSLRLAKQWPFVVVAEPQILYRQSSGSMSTNFKKVETACWQVCEQALAQITPDRIKGGSKQQLEARCKARISQYLAQIALNNLQNRQTLGYASTQLWQCIRLWPGMLLESKTQRLVVKFLLLSLSPSSGRKVLKRITLQRGSSCVEA